MEFRRLSRAAIWLSALMTPFGLQAAEGRLEINHSCALSGCFSGDSPGYPITITAPGSYLLTSDLVLPAGSSGIVLSTDDIHVDLNDFTVRGPATCEPGACASSSNLVGVGREVVLAGGLRSSVHGGSVVGIDGTGIRLDDGSRVERVLVSHARDRGIDIMGTNAFVVGNSVTHIGTGGIRTGKVAWVKENAVSQVGLRGSVAFAISIGSPTGPAQGNACDDGRCTRFRRYYLSQNEVSGASPATNGCINGFHMASLWELFDPTELSYDADPSYSRTAPDAGSGPPLSSGWIRTGFDDGGAPGGSFGIPGFDNCNAWTSTSGLGTVAGLNPFWNASASYDVIYVSPWLARNLVCENLAPVWCVED